MDGMLLVLASGGNILISKVIRIILVFQHYTNGDGGHHLLINDKLQKPKKYRKPKTLDNIFERRSKEFFCKLMQVI